MSTTSTGRRAEQAVADYLEESGFQIIERNWRTRYCEIDIIAHLKGIIYFVEVKYRTNAQYGAGLDYITPTKLRRMYFAAELWVARHLWPDGFELAAAAVVGPRYVIESFVTNL